MRVLDVAAGTGNASIPAAERGARVTASDLTPELLEAGQHRAVASTWGASGAEVRAWSSVWAVVDGAPPASEGCIDLALRISTLTDSSLVARKIDQDVRIARIIFHNQQDGIAGLNFIAVVRYALA